MTLVMAMLDVVGVASIMPFMVVLANPHFVETNTLLASVYTGMGFSDVQHYLIFLGVVVFVALVASLIFKAITTYAQFRFALMREYSIGRRLVEGYLHQPYTWFLNRHSAELGKTILSEVNSLISGALLPFMLLTSNTLIVILMICVLIFAHPKMALLVSGGLGTMYACLYIAFRRKLSRIGSERYEANDARFLVLHELFGAIKEVKVRGLEQVFIRRYTKPAMIYASHAAVAVAAQQWPRYALEGMAFGGLIIFLLFLLAYESTLETALPIISLYAFAGYRLLPALQQIYQNLAQLRVSGRTLDSVHADMLNLNPAISSSQEVTPMPLSQFITLNGIQFTYPKASQPSLQDLNLSIPARGTVGLVGSTGSGKTTTVDLILGLLEPEQGRLEVDGTPIDATNRRQWQRTIGYVPQHIYLADDTIAANIAFGLGPDEIDQAAVVRAARIANLHDFVVNELPLGYTTTVGERGVRLSGGQRQRIGIARALYHNPQVLILDEATSALDNLTEQAVMEAVHNLGHEVTIILIAHRLSTVRECDQIYLLGGGRVTAQGTYDELVERNETFRAMTGHSPVE
ncbi:MAG: ABC transporter ATP-binding protein [Betaproteobacteria bacterium]|nr:ABC transporter ATP-binding protein [Betaproteobacteria bacterium]